MYFAMNLNSERCKIAHIYDNTPFAKAGAQEGDIVLTLDGIKFDGATYGQIKKMWYNSQIGEEHRITLLRNGQEITSALTVPPGTVSRFEKK